MIVSLEIEGKINAKKIDEITARIADAVNDVLKQYGLRCVDVSPEAGIIAEHYIEKHNEAIERIKEATEDALKKVEVGEKRKSIKALGELMTEFEKFKKDEIVKLLDTVDYEELAKIPKVILVKYLYYAMVQACADTNNNGDSMALSYYADALRLLAKLRLFEIEDEYGRRVIGKFKVDL